ncbi:MAG: ribonuclease III domain-containing protein [Coriobacteriia bacterium]|nr:ribonuclease III domain-containing protein [Coriobacteriia bacterium]
MENLIDIKDHKERLAKAEKILGYEFKDKSILLKALTHPSAVQGSSTEHSYERYEFLGDALLEAIASFSVFRKYENMDEGKLTHMRVALVSGENLSKVAQELGLADLIIFGKSEQSTGKRGMKSALENVYEALVAAIFLDGGQVRC